MNVMVLEGMNDMKKFFVLCIGVARSALIGFAIMASLSMISYILTEKVGVNSAIALLIVAGFIIVALGYLSSQKSKFTMTRSHAFMHIAIMYVSMFASHILISRIT